PGQQAHVDQWNQRVVVTGHHQGRLTNLVQPVDAGPAEAGEQLPVVAHLAARAHLARVRHGQFGIAAEGAAVDVRGDAYAIGRLHIAPWAGHAPEHLGFARHHHRTGRGGGEDQLLASLRVVVGELLGQGAAPGHADGVDLTVVEVIQHACRQLGQAREAIGCGRGRRAADAGYVEGDEFQLRIEGGDEGHHQLQVGTDAVEDQQRHQLAVTRPHRGADGLPIEIDGAEYEWLRHGRSPCGVERWGQPSGPAPGLPGYAWFAAPAVPAWRAALPDAAAVEAIDQRSCTYVLGAASPAWNFLLPRAGGAFLISPERSVSQFCQCSHQESACLVAPSSHSRGEAGRSLLVEKRALGLPGGLRMLWMCPLLERMNSTLQPLISSDDL